MSTTDPADDRPRDEGPTDHESIANDRFIHGLLSVAHDDADAKRDDCINTVLETIREPQRSLRWRHHPLFAPLIPLATAALLTLVVLSFFVLTPESTAYSLVGDAIRATQQAPELRYEIRITDPARHAGEERIVGSIDMRGDFLRVELETPQGHDFIMGSDREGEWSLRTDGSVERFDPRAAAPRWINVGESTILVGGLDALLEELRDDDYTISHAERALDPSGAVELTTLIATRRPGAAKRGPDVIQVWIDGATSLVDTLELRWTQPSRPQARRDSPPQSDNAPDMNGDPSRPPHGNAPPPDRPRLLSGRPRIDDNRHPPPPERIVFQRVAPIDLSDDQFSPPVF